MRGYVKEVTFGTMGVSIDDEVIINVKDYIHNVSRVPLTYAGEDKQTIVDLLREIKKKCEEANIGTRYEKYIGLLYVVVLLASSFFLNKGEPLKIAEIGSNSGVLSMLIAPLLKAFDPEAEYVCISNAIGNESGVEWVDRIATVEAPSGLSFLVSDFHNTKLRDDHFDLTIINGTQGMPLPLETIREAERITGKEGVIFCISDDQDLLDDGFRLLTNEHKEYRFMARRVIHIATKKAFLE